MLRLMRLTPEHQLAVAASEADGVTPDLRIERLDLDLGRLLA